MIYFDASNTYPNSFLFNPLGIDPSVNTMYPISGKPVSVVLTSNMIYNHSDIFTDHPGLINKCKAIHVCIENNKEKLLLSEVGKFYYYGRRFLSFNALLFMAYNLPYFTVNEKIYKVFNRNPEFYAKVISSKAGAFCAVRPVINSLEQIYSMGIAGYSEQTLIASNSTIVNNSLRSARCICWYRLMAELRDADYIARSILNNIDNIGFNSRRYNRALRFIEINKGLRKHFNPASIGSVI